MAELTNRDRLQPALLDRLTDNDPDRQTEPAERRALSLSQLRASVLRDLNWLMNSTRLFDSETAARYPEVARSVVNYGLPAFSGFAASGLSIVEMESSLRTAILEFEPRLLAADLQVSADMGGRADDGHNVVSFQIECRLWAQPAPVYLMLKSNMNLESGQTQVTEAS